MDIHTEGRVVDPAFDQQPTHKKEDSVASPGNNRVDQNTSDTYSFWILIGTILLLPIFAIPSIAVPFEITKTVVISVGVLLAVLVTIVTRLNQGKLTLPSHIVLYAVWILPLVYFVSALLTEVPKLSFLGRALESDTFILVTLMAVLTTLVVMVMRKKEQVFASYLVLFISFILLSVFQGLRLIFGPGFLAFDTFTQTTSNLLGKWNDLSIFFGLATIMILVTLASLKLSAIYRGIMYATLFISLFFLALVNFTVTWAIVGIVAFGFFVHSVGIGRFHWNDEDKGSTGVSVAAAMVFIIATFFVGSSFTANDNLGNTLSNQFNISQVEARPSWTSTLNVVQNSYQDSAVFGSGPNTFAREWVASRPQELNNTIFWNTDFASGIGTIPTAFVNVGIVGGLVWLLIIVLYAYSGFRALVVKASSDRSVYYLNLSSFLAGLYLWLHLIFYTPNVVLIALTFFFTGLFIASLRHNETVTLREKSYVFAGNPKVGFVSVFSLTLLLLLTLISSWLVFNVYRSALSFQSGLVVLNVDGNIDAAQDLIADSATIYETDRQFRLLTDISTARVAALQSATELSEDELREQFQFRLAQAVEAGQLATQLDPTNYQNWVSLGRVYQSVVPLGIEGAYESALASYDRAVELNPNGPDVYLTKAELELANNNVDSARDHLITALQLKGNYTEAIFLLSQLEISAGNVEAAIESTEAAAILIQNNPVIFFQLGLLKYNQEDNEGARVAFARAVQLSSDYANALYFLGLTEARLGMSQNAIALFERVQQLNPDNPEVQTVLNNLRSGQEPFAGQEVSLALPDSLPLEETPEGETADEVSEEATELDPELTDEVTTEDVTTEEAEEEQEPEEEPETEGTETPSTL